MSKPRVLIVEDDEVTCRLTVQKLKEWFDFETAGTLGESIEKISLHRPDLVLLDLNLPCSQGIKTFERMHDIYGNPVIPYSGLFNPEELLRYGAQDVIFKGIDSPDTMRWKMTAALIRTKVQEDFAPCHKEAAKIVAEAKEGKRVLEEATASGSWSGGMKMIPGR